MNWKKSVPFGLIMIAAAVFLMRRFSPFGESKNANKRESSPSEFVLACQGRVEGSTDTVHVGAASNGVVKAVYVREGEVVKRGTLLAELDCGDLKASLREAQAATAAARQELIRVVRGSRREEREAAAQKTLAAAAVLDRAKTHLSRVTSLYDSKTISRDEFEQSMREYKVAEALLRAASAEADMANAGPLPEEVAKARSIVEGAEHHVQVVEQQLDKCTITAPISGSVLRVDTHVGESFSTFVPKPLFTMADSSTRRVRAEVDETDVAYLHIGQSVSIESDAFSGRHFDGQLSRIGSQMGRRTVSSGDPSEKSDRDVLEAFVTLGADAQVLPLGLRVLVRFRTSSRPSAKHDISPEK